MVTTSGMLWVYIMNQGTHAEGILSLENKSSFGCSYCVTQ